MAGSYQPSPASPPNYQGLPSLFGYENADGKLVSTNCGLAASATMLTYLGKMQADLTPTPNGNPNMLALESTYPPNILFGLAGTSRGRVERILEAYGCEGVEVDGEDALRQSIQAGLPVAVMLQVPGNAVLGVTMPAGHWMVAYGFDDQNIFLTNCNSGGMTWDAFRQGWSDFLPWCIDMKNKGLQPRLNP